MPFLQRICTDGRKRRRFRHSGGRTGPNKPFIINGLLPKAFVISLGCVNRHFSNRRKTDIASRLLYSRVMDKAVRQYLARIGRKGGKSRSEEKLSASRANMAIAREARRKYPNCPRYKNHSHRFAKSGRCACGYQRPVAAIESRQPPKRDSNPPAVWK
jgi:hypothetical protein